MDGDWNLPRPDAAGIFAAMTSNSEYRGSTSTSGQDDAARRRALRPGRLPTAVQVPVLLTGLATGLLVLMISSVLDARLVVAGAWFMVAYCGLVLLSLHPPPFFSAQLDRFLDEWVEDLGVGYYAVAALAFFIPRQIQTTLSGDFSSFVIEWILKFSMETFFNVFHAMTWPFLLINRHGMWPALGWVGATYGVFWIGTRAFSTPAWMLEKDDRDEAEAN